MADVERRPLAAVTGASSGIGLELARQFGEHGFDLVVCAAGERIEQAAAELRTTGATVTAVRADLSSWDGVEDLVDRIESMGQPLDALAVNAGVGAGGAFIDTDLQDHLDLISLNVTGLVHLTWRLLPAMVSRGEGRVLFTSSIAAEMPAPYQSTYGASKAFVQSFAIAVRNEVKDSGVTVTSLMPGPTDTEFFERADLEDSRAGRSKKDDPAKVAKDGFEALMAGKDHVVAGSVKNKVMTTASDLIPEKASAAVHGAMNKSPE
jgi:short-subunit dehydrogenase